MSWTEVQLTLSAGTLPNLNEVPAPGAKPVPVIVTDVPPASGPLEAFTFVTVGLPYLKWSFEVTALVPPLAVTRTSTVSDGEAGDSATIVVSELTVNLIASAVPKDTLVTPVKPVPVIVTEVWPEAGPVFGESFLTVGAGAVPTSIVRAVPVEVPSEANTVRATM